MRARRFSVHVVCASILAVVLFGTACSAASQGEPGASVEITFLDVGQADAVLIRDSSGRTALIDAGRAAPLPRLRERGVEAIDLLVATHPHADHIGGMEDLIEALPVRFYMDNGDPHTTATYARLMDALVRRPSITYLEATPRSVGLGETRIEVLPLPAAGSTDLNDRSVGLVVRLGSFLALLTGDSETGELEHFLRAGVADDVALLKAPHHGSSNGVTAEFLEATRPEVVVVSVGENAYGHPSPVAMAAYGRVARSVYRTDVHGDVTVVGYADGSFEVRTQRGSHD